MAASDDRDPTIVHLDRMRQQLDALNESIYEPEEHMQPSERARRIRRRDALYEQIQELERAED